MRNWFDTGCDCNNPEPIVGAIVGGKKFIAGMVKQSEYDADMEEIQEKFSNIDANLTNITTQRLADFTLLSKGISDNKSDITKLNSYFTPVEL